MLIFFLNIDSIFICQNDFDICEPILKLLSIFNNTTYTFNIVYQPTFHLFMIKAINIVEAFNHAE